MKKRFLFMPAVFLFICFFMSGCVNGRIWGDNFLRGWFRGAKLCNSVNDNAIHSTEIRGITGKEAVGLTLSVSIPLVILLWFYFVSRKKSLKTAVSLLVLLIEHCHSSDEMKRLSRLFSCGNTQYRKLIDNELKNFEKLLKKE